MKTILPFCLFVLSLQQTIQAQETIGRDVIAPAGDRFENIAQNMVIHWTLGELASEKLGGPAQGLIITQGFQQWDDGIVSVKELTIEDMGVSVFPNPFMEILSIRLEQPGSALTVRLIDPEGRILTEKFLLETSHELDMSGFPPGLYFLHFLKDREYHGVIKIAKLQ